MWSREQQLVKNDFLVWNMFTYIFYAKIKFFLSSDACFFYTHSCIFHIANSKMQTAKCFLPVYSPKSFVIKWMSWINYYKKIFILWNFKNVRTHVKNQKYTHNSKTAQHTLTNSTPPFGLEHPFRGTLYRYVEHQGSLTCSRNC